MLEVNRGSRSETKNFQFSKATRYGEIGFQAIVRTMGQEDQEGESVNSHAEAIKNLSAEIRDVVTDISGAFGLPELVFLRC